MRRESLHITIVSAEEKSQVFYWSAGVLFLSSLGRRGFFGSQLRMAGFNTRVVNPVLLPSTFTAERIDKIIGKGPFQMGSKFGEFDSMVLIITISPGSYRGGEIIGSDMGYLQMSA